MVELTGLDGMLHYCFTTDHTESLMSCKAKQILVFLYSCTDKLLLCCTFCSALDFRRDRGMLLGVELNLTIFFEVKPGACMQCSFLTGLLSRIPEEYLL